MTREEIISGLQMTMDLVQFDPATGNVRPIYALNDLDKTTYLACKEAIEALKAQDNVATDTVYRQAAIDATWEEPSYTDPMNVLTEVRDRIKALPPAQLDRDIPKKPNETTDKTCGIPNRLAVCPNCDSYLGIIHFISQDAKLKVSYCESCGQAIDWEGWEEED